MKESSSVRIEGSVLEQGKQLAEQRSTSFSGLVEQLLRAELTRSSAARIAAWECEQGQDSEDHFHAMETEYRAADDAAGSTR
ncbi:hypothetical protein [Nocardia pseudobrasiliensis]|uniref:Uncharacterized protein n=1 Tax=Nocardia pseudobrasiliensis TaxID=45979 RepID=A0A370HTV5_9NOCA|nr:hypothetical protein [Nocardia pseudobrasiliensis]RDI60404.1 hypothetical protein DFR76_11532 [Nocardia pseudobrasiliensis]